MAGFSIGQGVPLHRGLQQITASTNPPIPINVYSGLDQTIPLFDLDRLFPARIILGVKADQARLYPGIL